ncbi:MAG: nucleotidyl transferase AbiEii/AbiGii toxin family protein [Solirubrobacteraceae bacterium]
MKTGAEEDGARLARGRKRVAFDRLLDRLVTIAPNSWLLKGGFALDLRLAERARATKDVDLDWQAAEADLLDTLLDAAAWDAADFFSFNIERTGPPQDRLGGSHRFRVAAALGGRPFETFLLDIGLRSEPVAGIETLTTPDLLSFAGIEPVTVRVVPLELQIAEKLHAYTRTHKNKRPSTRTKDLVDLSLIAELSTLDAAVLKQAIDTTFSSRATDQLPTYLPPPPDEWRTPFRRLAQAVGVADDLEAGYTTAAALLNPILSGKITHGRWQADTQRWAR